MSDLRPLYFDSLSLFNIAEMETDEVYFNLLEDIRCLKEQVATKKGYAIVPIEPSDEMLDAGRVATHNKVYPRDMTIGPRMIKRDEYKAMIAAAQGELNNEYE